PRLVPHVSALADPDTGLAREDVVPQGIPWQEPDSAPGGRVNLHTEVDTTGRTADRRADFDSVYGDWSLVADHVSSGGPERLEPAVLAGPRLAAPDPASLLAPEHEAAALALLACDGTALDELARIADDLRRETVGDDVTYVVNRNINFTNVCYVGCRFCAFA